MRIVSGIAGLAAENRSGMEVTETAGQVGRRWSLAWRLFWAARKADYLLIHFSLPEVLFHSVLAFVWPGVKCRLVTLDFFAISPPGWAMPLIRWSLRRAGALLVFFRSHEGIQRAYGLPAGKLRYIPFKINAFELIEQAETREENYIFVGGRSRRDFATLFAAAARLPSYKFQVLTTTEPHLRPHGSTLEGLVKPPNVELEYRDSEASYFVEVMSRARLVVLPIRQDAAVQAGIGVCYQALGLGKCVIISEALGISDVLVNGEAVIVKPGDAGALAREIEHYWESDEDRWRVAARAREYGRKLGGEATLYRSVLQAIEELNTSREEKIRR